jgi:hypothetical protein
VLHYLGPHASDSTEVRAWFRAVHDLDVILEPVGGNESGGDETSRGDAGGGGCGAEGCGHGGCASVVGGEGSSAESSGRGCGTSAHSGCSSCGIMRAMAERNQRMAENEDRLQRGLAR